MTGGARERASLVTGGAGFIGSWLVRRLLDRGGRVIVVDDLSTGRFDNLAGTDDARLTFIESTVSEAAGRLDPAGIGEIYHLAAAVGVRLVIGDPIGTIETNVFQTSAALELAEAACSPILVASTSEVYGKSERLPYAEDDDVVYGPPSQPRWAYACSKAIDEFLALSHHRAKRLHVVVARFFNVVGPRQVGRYGMVLPRFVAAALAGDPIEVYGDGRQTRCFCDVRDVVGVLPVLVADPACAGKVYNVGSDRPIEIGALAETVRDVLSSSSKIINVPYERAFGSGFDDLRHRRPDLTRLREATGFAPLIPLEQTIRDLAGDLSRRRVTSAGPAA